MVTGVPYSKEVNKERRKVALTCLVMIAQPIFDCKRYAKWKRILTKITAYSLTHDELHEAETYWIKQAQSNLFGRLKK